MAKVFRSLTLRALEILTSRMEKAMRRETIVEIRAMKRLEKGI